MEAKARLTNANINIDSGRTCLTFEFAGLRPESIESLRDTDLRIKAVKWREKRSLTANAYFHVLVARIAEALGESNTVIKNQLISDYGFPELPGVQMILKDKHDWRKLEGVHLHPTAATKVLENGDTYRVFFLMRGSHTYDSKEMARLIDGTVSEAKALDIETIPDHELKRLVEEWHG